ncbi:MAG: MFS transporter [Actinomycetia bacterium]|nr:MFS transporter [Actinomycetes bacterium]
MTTDVGGVKRLVHHRLVVTGVVALLGGYVSLGLFDGVLGITWSQVRHEFDRPVADLPWMWVPHAIGYLVASLLSGYLVNSFQPRRVLFGGCSVALVGLIFVVVAPSMWLLSIAILPVGLGNGLLDSAGNTYVTLTGGPRVMHLLHSAYGVGVTLGPLLAAGVVDLDVSWRLTYLVLVIIQALVLVLMARLKQAGGVTVDETRERFVGIRGGTAILMVAFGIYVALEVGVGQWTYSLLVDSRGMDEGLAGLVVAAYWGALLAGRLMLAALGNRVDGWTSLTLSTGGLVVGAVLFLADPGGFGYLGAPLVGVSAAAVFPTMVLLTPQIVGSGKVASAVGFQFASSSAAAVLSSILIGWTVSRSDVDVAAVWYLGLAAAFAVVFVVLRSRFSTS